MSADTTESNSARITIVERRVEQVGNRAHDALNMAAGSDIRITSLEAAKTDFEKRIRALETGDTKTSLIRLGIYLMAAAAAGGLGEQIVKHLGG